MEYLRQLKISLLVFFKLLGSILPTVYEMVGERFAILFCAQLIIDHFCLWSNKLHTKTVRHCAYLRLVQRYITPHSYTCNLMSAMYSTKNLIIEHHNCDNKRCYNFLYLISMRWSIKNIIKISCVRLVCANLW